MLNVSATTRETLSDAHCKVLDDAKAHFSGYCFDNSAHFGFQFWNVSRLIYIHPIFSVPPQKEVRWVQVW